MGTNRKRLVVGAVLVVAVAALIAVNGKGLRSRSDTPQVPADQQSVSQAQQATSPTKPSAANVPGTTPTLAAQNTTLPDLVGDTAVRPTVDRVRAEVAANPHATPMVLVDFASKMASMMTAAMASPDAAEQAALQLDQCVQGDSTQWIESARALCLANYAKLAHAHPELKDRFLATRDSAEPRVVMLVRQMNAISR